jgi:hypothetical protein
MPLKSDEAVVAEGGDDQQVLPRNIGEVGAIAFGRRGIQKKRFLALGVDHKDLSAEIGNEDISLIIHLDSIDHGSRIQFGDRPNFSALQIDRPQAGIRRKTGVECSAGIMQAIDLDTNARRANGQQPGRR